ncbi:MAG: Uma2 family endonuclease [Gemmataceae bacterium]
MIRKLDRGITPEELLLRPDGDRYEIVNGQLVEKDLSVLSSWVETQLSMELALYCKTSKRGQSWNSSLGYRIFRDDPNKLRRPDGTFISAERFSPEMFVSGYMTVVPDMAAEVVSDNDLAYEVDEKIEDYLRAGVKLVWVINPETRTVMIHRLDGSTTKLHEDDFLDGENVLPGFRIRVQELFPEMPSV